MTTALYQLTATAAQMCLPVPVPAAAPDGFLDLLDHWQTLIGATAGGLLGVAGAWIVAVSARSRERRIAASLVLPDLMQLVAAGASLEQEVGAIPNIEAYDPERQAVHRASLYVGKLERQRPSLFALQTPAIGQLSDIDARLYSHLFQCQMSHRSFEDGMTTRRAAREVTPPIGYEGMARFVSTGVPDPLLYAAWQRCVEHATLANYYLDRLVFSRWPRWWHRVRMALRPNELDRRSAALLNPGMLSAPGPQPSAAPAGAT
ncbi:MULTISPECIES: hypothetical protein [Burkholderia]|uniref:hypothetical protein n=1 Tax=Burkholderia TaxID=32008 RepID=UPI0011AE1254|nr:MULTISPECIES: hypothetical protein [Burkholderia cepacia complex]MDN7893331.1 hypothetical protein [Burkholderia cepacia]